MSKVAIFLFNITPAAYAPWLEAGYVVYTFDAQFPVGVTQEGNIYKVGGYLEPDSAQGIVDLVGEKNVRFVGAFPPCDDLAVSGARHFAAKLARDPDCQRRAVGRAKLAEQLGEYYECPWFAENPVSVMSTLWRRPDHKFHPWHFGGYLTPDEATHPDYPEYIAPRDAYPKQTCLWTGGGFRMPELKVVAVPPGYSTQFYKLGGKSLKTKNIRSATPRGFARAVFEANHHD